MRLLSLLILLSVSLCLSPVPSVAGTQQGFVTSVLVRASDGLVYFFVSGTPSNRPSCATGAYWMIRDETSVAGKQQLAQLLTAYAAGTTIVVYGTNTCTRWPNGEDVEVIQMR